MACDIAATFSIQLTLLHDLQHMNAQTYSNAELIK